MKKLKVLDLYETGGVGGKETLCLNSAQYTAHDHTYLFLWKGGEISDEMIKRGYKVEVWNTSVKKYLSDCIRIAMKCRNEEYDVVICQGLNPFIALCAVMIHFFSKHTRILGYVHFSPEDWKQKTALSFRVIFKYSEKIICISDYVLNSVKKRFGYDNKLVRIYNGVDVSKFSCSGVTTKKSGHRLVYVGRLIEKKGVDITLRALSKVTADFHFDIIGDGIYRSKLEEQVKELGLEEKVTFHGNVLNIRPLLESSDIFIHVPTLEEGFGLTVVEAMAAGLLCICSKSGALPEIIENGVTGYLVEKDNPEELSRVIQSSIENYKNEQNEDIRKNAVEKAKKYTIDSYSDNIDKIASEIRGGG